MSEAPRRWSRATPPAHGAVDGGVTAETPEVTVPGSWGQGAGPPGLPPRRFYPKPGAGLCLATSHLHFQVRPHPMCRVVLQVERLRSPGQQQQVAQTIQMPSSAPAGPAPGCRCPPPPPPLPPRPPEMRWGKPPAHKAANNLNERNFFVLCKSQHMICY
ncbi:uncharacterized protein [Muntiacus reevesi]